MAIRGGGVEAATVTAEVAEEVVEEVAVEEGPGSRTFPTEALLVPRAAAAETAHRVTAMGRPVVTREAVEAAARRGRDEFLEGAGCWAN
jgi:hypothetical protein